METGSSSFLILSPSWVDDFALLKSLLSSIHSPSPTLTPLQSSAPLNMIACHHWIGSPHVHFQLCLKLLKLSSCQHLCLLCPFKLCVTHLENPRQDSIQLYFPERMGVHAHEHIHPPHTHTNTQLKPSRRYPWNSSNFQKSVYAQTPLYLILASFLAER